MGKVHGSLTSAGKVRKATKRPEKTVKRAKVRGRALKRLKYNKRFVSIKIVNGRPARPNMQPPGKLG
jgi:small subunit ribosomal protein S30e